MRTGTGLKEIHSTCNMDYLGQNHFVKTVRHPSKKLPSPDFGVGGGRHSWMHAWNETKATQTEPKLAATH